MFILKIDSLFVSRLCDYVRLKLMKITLAGAQRGCGGNGAAMSTHSPQYSRLRLAATTRALFVDV